MKVMMLNGSWNHDGSTKAGLDEMAKAFAAEGVETEIISIGAKPAHESGVFTNFVR